MRKSLTAYVVTFGLCQFVLIAVLHLAAALHGAKFKSMFEGDPLPPATVWTLAGVRWLYLLPAGFLISTFVAARRHAADTVFLHILAGLMITSLVLSIFVLLALSCPLVEVGRHRF